MALGYLPSFEGGHDDLHFGVDMGVTAAFSVLIYDFALSRRLSSAEAEERIADSSKDELAV